MYTNRNLCNTRRTHTNVIASTRATPTLQTASLRWVEFAYENQEVSRLVLASYSRRRRTGLGRVPGTGTTSAGEQRVERRAHSRRRQKLLCSAAGCSLASAALNIQWRHVLDSACRLAAANHMFPHQAWFCIPTRVSPLFPLSLSLFFFSSSSRCLSRAPALSIYLLSPDSSFHLNVHQCFQRNFLISSNTERCRKRQEFLTA